MCLIFLAVLVTTLWAKTIIWVHIHQKLYNAIVNITIDKYYISMGEMSQLFLGSLFGNCNCWIFYRSVRVSAVSIFPIMAEARKFGSGFVSILLIAGFVAVDIFRNFNQILGSFYCVYTREHYYWQVVVIARRLLIAILASFVPFNNPVSCNLSLHTLFEYE